MIVAIDCLFMQKDTMGGMEVFTVSLLKALAESGGGNRFIIFCGSDNAHYFSGFKQSNISVEPLPVETENKPRRILYEQLVLPRILESRWKHDLFFGPAHVLPLALKSPCVLTIHDLHWMNMKDTPLLKRAYIDFFIKKSISKADRIVADSFFTKQDIFNKFPSVSSDKIDVAYAGIDSGFSSGSPECIGKDEYVLRKYGIEKPFVLNVGQHHKRKNLSALLKAFADVDAEVRKNFKIVLVGGPGDDPTDLKQLSKEIGIEDKLILTGIVAQYELPSLYRAAEIFIYPSKWEGFGMPVAEAMASGTMVICSNSTSVAEVAGNACVLSPPEQAPLSEAIAECIADSDRRKRFAGLGLERAKAFSWEKTAETYLKSFAKALSG